MGRKRDGGVVRLAPGFQCPAQVGPSYRTCQFMADILIRNLFCNHLRIFKLDAVFPRRQAKSLHQSIHKKPKTIQNERKKIETVPEADGPVLQDLWLP